MFRLITSIFIMSLGAVAIISQEQLKIGRAFCSVEIIDSDNDVVTTSTSDAKVDRLITNILKAAGLEQNFTVRAYDRFNAEAWYDGKNRTRYIFYNTEFLESIREKTGSEWGPAGIMAHEIAHHLLGHTVEHDTSSRQMELGADRYAGFVLCKMNVKLGDAQSGFSVISSEVVSPKSKHPDRSTRMKKVEEGWLAAGCSATRPAAPKPADELAALISSSAYVGESAVQATFSGCSAKFANYDRKGEIEIHSASLSKLNSYSINHYDGGGGAKHTYTLKLDFEKDAAAFYKDKDSFQILVDVIYLHFDDGTTAERVGSMLIAKKQRCN